MTRFLMSLDDAVLLVEHAFAHARPGDLFIRKAPACTVEDLAEAVASVLGRRAEIQVIGTRHGEKLYETLATREELARAEDQGDYFRVPVDARDLNYSEYFDEGDVEREQRSTTTTRTTPSGSTSTASRCRRACSSGLRRQFRAAVVTRTWPMSRVLAIHRYYWPDTPPYASMLRAIVGALDTPSATRSTCSPASRRTSRRRSSRAADAANRWTASTVRRLRDEARPQLAGVGGCSTWCGSRWPSSCASCLGRRYDVVMCSTAPPVLLGRARRSLAARCGAPPSSTTAWTCTPRSARLSGEFASRTVYRAARRLDTRTCRRAAAIVVLSDDMERAVLARDPATGRPDRGAHQLRAPGLRAGEARRVALAGAAGPTRLRIVFTGNIGRFQGLETIIAGRARRRPSARRLQLVFMGEGAAKHRARARSSQAAAGEARTG